MLLRGIPPFLKTEVPAQLRGSYQEETRGLILDVSVYIKKEKSTLVRRGC